MARFFLVLFMLLMLSAPAFSSDPRETIDSEDALMGGAIVVKGEGSATDGQFTEAQKRIMALRAAKSVALREASEMLDGVTVSGETTVLNAATSSDVISTAAEGIVRGASVVKEEYDAASGMAVIYLSVPMHEAQSALMSALSGLVPDAPQYRPPMAASTARYDGVIIDARGKGLKPALVNRVLSKQGEVIYDPSKVSTKVLSSNGAAAYTNDVAKAKALLAKRGALNPLVVRAERVSRSTDAELGPIEAGAVFYSNQSMKYLEAAMVVFVLD